jgi:hypothetical protein
VKQTLAEMEEGAKLMAKMMKSTVLEGSGKREYRDHRLEWMIKSGGMDVVLEGIERGNVRLGWPPAAEL